MHNLIKRRLDAFDRVVEFGTNHPLTPAIAAVTALYTQVGNVITALRGHKGDQESGRGEFLSGSSIRALRAEQLLAGMRSVNKIARSLDRDQHPGVREKFYLPKSRSYEEIIGRAQAFLEALGPIKALFVERGMPGDFDEQLATDKDALVAATNDKNAGLAEQVGGTAGLLAKSRNGLKLVHELDAILSYQYRNDPALLAAWKSACHVARAKEPVETPAGTPTAAPATAPAPAATPTA